MASLHNPFFVLPDSSSNLQQHVLIGSMTPNLPFAWESETPF